MVASAEPRPRTAPGDKYEAILAAALHLFVERGFYGVAVPEVAKRAKVAAGTIYTYFPSKEALVNALYRKWKAAVGQRVFTEFPVNVPPREQFDVMWASMTQFAFEHRDAFAFLELHHHASYLDRESRELENQLKEFAAGALMLGQATGVIKPTDPKLLMELLFGAFTGMMRAHVEGRLELGEQAILDAREACWQMLAVASR